MYNSESFLQQFIWVDENFSLIIFEESSIYDCQVVMA
jgi:hypothetical protein